MKGREFATSRTIITLVIMTVTAWFLYAVRSILMPFIISAVLAYLLSPVVRRFEDTGMRRLAAVILMYVFFLSALVAAVFVFVPQISYEIKGLANDIPAYAAEIKKFIVHFQESIETRYPFVRELALFENAFSGVQGYFERELSSVPGYIAGLISTFTLIFLIPLLTFFFVLGGRRAVEKAFELMPGMHVERGLSIFWEVDEVLGRFIRGQITEAAAVAILSMAGLMIIGVNYAVVIGIVAGIANMVPYAGPAAGATLGVIAGVIQYQEFSIALKVIIVFAIVQLVDNQIIQPIVLGQGVRLNPAMIVFSIMAGAEIYGIIGMLLAVPVAGIIKTTIGIFLHKR